MGVSKILNAKREAQGTESRFCGDRNKAAQQQGISQLDWILEMSENVPVLIWSFYQCSMVAVSPVLFYCCI
jgi:hypothetical protein